MQASLCWWLRCTCPLKHALLQGTSEAYLEHEVNATQGVREVLLRVSGKRYSGYEVQRTWQVTLA